MPKPRVYLQPKTPSGVGRVYGPFRAFIEEDRWATDVYGELFADQSSGDSDRVRATLKAVDGKVVVARHGD